MRSRNFLFLICFCAQFAFGQTQISSGDIVGTVVDETSAVIPDVTVIASDSQRGTARTARTDASGEYRFTVLPPGVYQLRFETEGFATQLVEGVEVHVGDTVALRTEMTVGAVTIELSVTAERPVVDSQRTQQATTIETQRIDQLPINQRNYLGFALLAPSVVETSTLADDSDFRVAQTPHSGLSFGGSNGRGNVFSIDGAEHYLNSGGVRPSVSQEAVQEFQINRNSFSAELGGASGGAINIVTKSGANKVRGNLFGFLRHRDVQARNYFDPAKSAYTRLQYGATIGAPLKQDKSFLFGSFERLDRHETAFVPILQDMSAFHGLTSSQNELASFLEGIPSPTTQQLAGLMRVALKPSSNPLTLKLFQDNSGTFPFGGDTTQSSLRLDHRFSDYHSVFLRGRIAKDLNENTEFGALIGLSRGRTVELIDSTVVLSDTYIFNPRWVMDTRAMFSYGEVNVAPNDPLGPELNIGGFGFFGRDIFLPSNNIERHWQLRQNFSYIGGKHDVKFGYDFNPVRDAVYSETFFGGRFGFGEAVPLGALLNSASGDEQASAKLVSLLTMFGRPDLALNLAVPINSLQAFSLGLPTFYQQGFGDPNWIGWSKRFNLFAQDTFRVTPRLVLSMGVRYELEDNEEVIGTDPNNIAPRFGFAWTPSENRGTVIRGGYGMYYSQINIQIPNVVDTLDGDQIAQVLVPLTGVAGVIHPGTGRPLTSADIYQTLLGQGVIGKRTITPQDLAQFGIQPGPGLPLQVLFRAEENYVNPYAHQASFEIEQAVGDVSISAGYNFNRGAHLPRSLDRNLFLASSKPDGSPIYGFHNPGIFQYNFYESAANSYYHALTFRAAKRFQNHVAVDAHYTWSKAIDEVTDFNTDFQPHNQLDARAEKALSSFHRGHRFVANAVLESPYRSGRGEGFAHNLLSDWNFSPILVCSSARPFNVLVGFDNVGDRHPNTHRPHGAGRNIGRGPDFFTLDLRLTRTFPFGDEGRRNVQFIAEVFNAANRTNFRSLNNIVGDIRVDELPQPLVGVRGSPTDPLGFSSALDPRQFQFGLKINY